MNCSRCPRLVRHRRRIRQAHPDYHCQPVEAWGDPGAPLLIVGLAPGLHGANRTGRPFTGDASGNFLFRHLAQVDLCEEAGPGDHRLLGCRITNAVKCLPPENRPVAAELRNCSRYLRDEIRTLPEGGVILALGTLAHQSVLRALELPLNSRHFRHGAEHELNTSATLLDSYHCSRYNTQTGRLTDKMFASVLNRALKRIEQ